MYSLPQKLFPLRFCLWCDKCLRKSSKSIHLKLLNILFVDLRFFSEFLLIFKLGLNLYSCCVDQTVLSNSYFCDVFVRITNVNLNNCILNKLVLQSRTLNVHFSEWVKSSQIFIIRVFSLIILFDFI